MKKILFPTDFSEAANQAFVYALNIARQMGAQIVTLHVYQKPDIRALHLPNTLQEVYNSIEFEEFENYRDSIPALHQIAEKHQLLNVPMTNALKEGDTIPVILQTAKEISADMIVLGTRGAGWVKEIFVGSVAGEVLENATCPVLAVPEEAVFDGTIDNIAVSTALTPEDLSALKQVSEWAESFNAQIHCVHVDTSNTGNFNERLQNFKLQAGKMDHVHFVSIENTDLEKGLIHYVEDNRIDILAMLTHKRSFLQELFNYSHAKMMSYHSKVPILSIHAENL